jgi:hypothetical protein
VRLAESVIAAVIRPVQEFADRYAETFCERLEMLDRDVAMSDSPLGEMGLLDTEFLAEERVRPVLGALEKLPEPRHGGLVMVTH